MNFAKLKIVEVPMAVRAEIEAHDLIEKALQQSGLSDEFWKLFNRGIGKYSSIFLIAFEHLFLLPLKSTST